MIDARPIISLVRSVLISENDLIRADIEFTRLSIAANTLLLPYSKSQT